MGRGVAKTNRNARKPFTICVPCIWDIYQHVSCGIFHDIWVCIGILQVNPLL